MKPTPTLQPVHSDSVSSLYYDPTVPCSLVVWHGFASSQDFRTACMRAFELAREHRISKSISDARNLRIISLADQQWFLEEYLPLVLDLRLSTQYYSATVMPQDYFGRQSVDAITEQALDIIERKHQDVQITTRFFSEVDDALDWLRSQPDTQAVQTSGDVTAEENSQAA